MICYSRVAFCDPCLQHNLVIRLENPQIIEESLFLLLNIFDYYLPNNNYV